MSVLLSPLLIAAFFLIAVLYSMVGHAGASGYLAVMAIGGLAPAVMKPTALLLNVLVAAIATYQFGRTGCFSWRMFWPFAITSIPLAFLGGALVLPAPLYKQIVGSILLYAAIRLFLRANDQMDDAAEAVPLAPALGIGAVIGFVSGLVGVGGGIFLSPILLFFKWTRPRTASGIAAAFILVNSVAGLLGQFQSAQTIPMKALEWAVPAAIAAAVGGWIGSGIGSQKLLAPAIRRCLGFVMLIAAAKMFIV